MGRSVAFHAATLSAGGVFGAEREASSVTPIRTFRMLATLAVAMLACHCGSSSTPGPNTIAISNYQYSPANLSVAPGTTVTVTNVDSMQHSVTSESVINAFTAGAVNGVQFDTGAFSASGTFTVPSIATAGTVIPYFCTVHLQTMGQGTITITGP
jgi:plastocyanin